MVVMVKEEYNPGKGRGKSRRVGRSTVSDRVVRE